MQVKRDQYTLDFMIQLLSFFGDAMGPQTEILIHDARTREIIWIKNGHVTGRTAGYENSRVALESLAERAKEFGTDPELIGYKSQTGDARQLRSSNLFLRDEKGELAYVICVNQDVSQVVRVQEMLNTMFGNTSLQIDKGFGAASVEENNIENMTINLIMEEIENSKPFTLDSRESKLEILRRLQEKGVFEVRRAVPKVCEVLQISQSSLYKYLQKLKDEKQQD